jgi:hypothetical protein
MCRIPDNIQYLPVYLTPEHMNSKLKVKNSFTQKYENMLDDEDVSEVFMADIIT